MRHGGSFLTGKEKDIGRIGGCANGLVVVFDEPNLQTVSTMTRSFTLSSAEALTVIAVFVVLVVVTPVAED